jgi:hypothetical protein
MAEDGLTAVDGIVGEYSSYEDYLDSQISATDLYYLEDEDLARQLVVRPLVECGTAGNLAPPRLHPAARACFGRSLATEGAARP